MAAIFREGFSFSGFERDLLALSLGNGSFLDVSGVSGIDSISDGRGASFADLDNDGDLDVFLTAMQREAHFLFRNNVGSDNGFIRVALEGTTSGRDAYGAVVRVKTSAGVLTKVKAGGSGFLSQSDPRLLFGLGSDPRAEWVEVTWPGGAVQRFEQIAAGSSLRIVEGRERSERVAERRFELVDPLAPDDALLARLRLRRGAALPDLELVTLDGVATRLGELLRPGRRHLVNVWATYCVPCAQEMPELQRLAPRLAGQGVELVGVSVDLDTADQVPAYLARHGIEYPVVIAPAEQVARIFPRGEVLLPTSFLLDDEGRVLEAFAGWSERSRAAIEALAGAS